MVELNFLGVYFSYSCCVNDIFNTHSPLMCYTFLFSSKVDIVSSLVVTVMSTALGMGLSSAFSGKKISKGNRFRTNANAHIHAYMFANIFILYISILSTL